MFAFPRFKYRQSVVPYRKQAVQNWESMVWKTGCILLLVEIARIIEDFNHGKYTVWSLLWYQKLINFGFCFIVTFGRFIVVKLLPRWKVPFLHVSELLILTAYILLNIYSKHIPSPPADPNPLWTAKESMVTYIRLICVCFSFYNWFLPFLLIASNASYVVYTYNSLLPQYTKIYLPSYAFAVFSVGLLCYFFEKKQRANFETHLEATMKEKVWKEILNQFPEGTLVVTEKKEVIYVNQAFYTILNIDFQRGFEGLDELKSVKDISIEGFSTSNSSGFAHDHSPITKFQELQDLIWSQWPSLVEYFSSHLTRDTYKIFKGQYQIDENKTKTVEIKFSIRNFGGKNVALFIFSDVSERLLVSYLRQSIEYKNRLLASVSHELRTPLNGNINFIQEAIQDPTVPQQIKDARLVPAVRSAQYLLILINDILDFSQIQAQNLRLVPTIKNILNTVKEAMQLVEIQAKKKGIYLSLTPLSKDWSYDIKTDHNRVLQIVANLLSNALKFTFSGGINVTIRPFPDHSVCIEVQDTGIGIKQEDQSKLFKTFGKLDLGGNNYMNSQGVGLGLVISNSLARMLGPKSEPTNPMTILLDENEGEPGIYFESEFGKGSKFWFRIADQGEMLSCSQRAIPSEGNEINEIPEFIFTETNAPLLTYHNICVCPQFIVADDDAFNILTLETLLASLGYKTEPCYHGQQVLEVVRKRIASPCGDSCEPYKMIFLDCNMPIMDGYECAQNLNQLFAKEPSFECPIIACTAAIHQSERDKALESGMTDFVTKPVSKKRIQELINNYCSKTSYVESPV